MLQTTTTPRPAEGRGAAVSTRKILHVDMDAFFAAIEQMDDPGLRGRPVAVGGDPRSRGVVAAASYEARAHGVRSAMPMSQALRLCPDLVRVSPRFGRYIEISRRILEVLRRWTPLVEPASLDEAYLDVTSLDRPAAEIATRIKAEIKAETGLTASAGAGPSKLVAKIASDMGKPDGLVVVPPARVRAFLAPLPIGRLRGVGPVTGRKLGAAGIRTIGDLARAREQLIRARVGSGAAALMKLARGQDDAPVVPQRRTRSISSERTLPEDTRDLRALDSLVDRFATEIAAGLRDERLRARTVVLKVRYADFTSVTRRRTLSSPFEDPATIVRLARDLMGRTGAGRRKVRLIGIAVTGLVERDEPFQAPLFPP
ncbi:MAG TPA: DNA polymerase IV [Candidatus Polarisedimenticolia bacterium]|nr:DNA polymerase IV [Candidatus Polarisedimenticolia bacterium]